MSSSTLLTDPVQSAPTAAAAKKKSSKKKKKDNKLHPKPVAVDQDKDDGLAHENDDLSDEPPTPTMNTPTEPEPDHSKTRLDGVPVLETANGHATNSPTTNGHPSPASPGTSLSSVPTTSDTHAKFEAMTQEREALRAEVEQLRRQLQDIQSTRGAEVGRLRSDLEESEAAKEHAEAQYQTLLGRVEKIKETLGDRLKRDKQELDEAKDRVEELEAANEALRKDGDSDASRLRDELAEQARELAALRSRHNLAQQNWQREKEDLARQAQHLRGELESTSNAMGEWEVIAMEERSMRESLGDKASDLEEQLASVREAYERAAAERDTQAQAIDGLQRALQEIQEARKLELREMVESSEAQLEELKRRTQEADSRATAAEAATESLARELERTAPFEKEVKEKNLLIGKLRHEAIVLNDHLTKALRYLKKTRPEESVDRQIVTNHLLQFLALDRSDPKKFQILQVIAGLLGWTDEQRETAGLARPGATSTSSLRLPTSPFHRTPSTPSLNTEFFSEPGPSSSAARGESLADLWTGFLERSVEEGSTGDSGSRKDSVSSVATTGALGRPDTGPAARPDTRG